MINVALFWYLLVPLVLSIATIFIFKRWVTGLSFHQILGSTVVGLMISAAIITGVFFAGIGSQTWDTEVLNGAVTSKKRDHGFYLRPYECNCTYVQQCSGSGTSRSCYSQRVCQTCYEDRYTVTWSCNSTIGAFTIEHLDEGSSSVYNTPDPRRFTIIEKGDPVSRTHAYTNYIKAVPETIFRPAQEQLKLQFAGKIPEYPDDIYDIYHINRLITVGVNVPDADYWNRRISRELSILGPAKEVNFVVVLVNEADPNYFYALQDAWLNSKKNDVVLVLGVTDYPSKPAWVNIMALTRDNIFQVKLRDRILALDSVSADKVIDALAQETRESFKRKEMKDFEYLKAEIDPPFWLMMVCLMLNIAAYVGFWIFAWKHHSVSSYNRYGIPRFNTRFR